VAAQALTLRTQSKTYRDIAAALGISVSTAHDAVQRGLRETMQEPADDLRRLELEKLDALERGALEVIQAQPHVVSGGQVTTQADEGLKLQALQTLLRVSESRRKLLGLDSAAKVTLDGGVKYEVVGVDLDKLS
jgi:transposase